MRIVLTLLLLVFCPLTATAEPAAITPEGAAHLKALFQEIQDRQTQKAAARNNGTSIEHQGEILVEPAGAYYAVTLPPAVIHLKNGREEASENETTMRIGMISINASPDEQPGQWKMSVALPTPIIIGNENTGKTVRLHIGSQNVSGIWNEDFQNFIRLDARYKNLSADTNETGPVLSISEVTMISDIKKIPGTGNENPRWSGPTNLTFSGLSITPPEKNAIIRIGNIAMNISSEQFSQNAMDRLQTLLENADTPPDSKTLLQTVTTLMNSVSTRFSVSDLAFDQNGDEMTEILDMSIDTPEELKAFSLSNFHVDFGFSGLMKDMLQMHFSIGYKDLDIQSENTAEQDFLPTEMTISINKNNIPVKQITTLLENELGSTGTIAPLSLMLKLPALLSTAKTEIKLDNTLGNDLYRIETNGEARADMTAVNGATAEITTRFKNMDLFLQRAKNDAADPGNENAEQYKKLAETLQLLKDIATTEQNAAGQTIHVFKLVMNETGEILLNGQPALPILGTLDFPAELFSK